MSFDSLVSHMGNWGVCYLSLCSPFCCMMGLGTGSGAMSGTVTDFLFFFFFKNVHLKRRALYNDYLCQIVDQEQEFLNFDGFIFILDEFIGTQPRSCY
jgi:hypothetical protein